ncbi:MAG: imidazole glycerol phosphate synthase subunit HisH [Negativicutes bacterium]|nr:imidazole glycerol phosphate synthase subunit HisH [Negativicutes bacterium]
MIAVIDYGMGNLYSVEKAFLKLGAKVTVTSDPRVISRAGKVVLPGVGAFGDCMANLKKHGLIEVIREAVVRDIPFLGICLGLQLLFEGSEEDPGIAGLGILPGIVRRIDAPGLKVPHMGWNSLDYRGASLLYRNLPPQSFVYFVHSYHALPTDTSLITATTDYGGPVTASVGRGKLQAVQFHPEKSGAVGMKILSNFKDLME